LVTLLLICLHLPYLNDGPNGYHRWREADTATVAENYATENGDFLAPRINQRGTGDGIVGTEFPVYTYAVSLLYRMFGLHHALARLVSLLGVGLCLFASWQLVTLLAPSLELAAVFVWLTAFAPLVYFYGGKIQPDIWGLGFAVAGAVQLIQWTRQESTGRLVRAACLLALAGLIKPTFFAVGLPLLFAVAYSRGWRTFKRPELWLTAIAALLPTILWLHYAQGLNAHSGSHYFYLGGNTLDEMRGALTANFYSNVLLTWPFDLVVGLPFCLYFVVGAYAWRRQANGRMMALWILGSLIVCAIAGNHCATAHDYYYLPAVPAFIFFTATGVTKALKSNSRILRVVTLVLLIGAPLNGWARMRGRYEHTPSFKTTRAAVVNSPAFHQLAVAVDDVPGYTLYMSGLKGFRLNRDAHLAELAASARAGAQYLVYATRLGTLSPAARALLGGPVVATATLEIYKLTPVLQAAPLPDAPVLTLQ